MTLTEKVAESAHLCMHAHAHTHTNKTHKICADEIKKEHDN